MATNYPGSNDVFNVPSSPTTTPLSSAGTGTRNHVTHHRDLGDAVMAIQANAAKGSHKHGGTGLDGPKLDQANTHQNPDTDKTAASLHHTIGTGATQAAAGNHTHSQYVDLTTAQSISGKKSFPSGGNAPVIPDFRNANHKHIDANSGGLVTAPMAAYKIGLTTVAKDNSYKLVNIGSDFTIPNGMTLMGDCVLQLIPGRWSGGWYNYQTAISFGVPSVWYNETENITTMGGPDGVRNGNFVFASGMDFTKTTYYAGTQIDTTQTMHIPFETTPSPQSPSAPRRLKLLVINNGGASAQFNGYIRFWLVRNTTKNMSTWATL